MYLILVKKYTVAMVTCYIYDMCVRAKVIFTTFEV